MSLLSLAAGLFAWRRREWLFHRHFLRPVAVCGPLGILSVEAGWVVTELGRQPWAIHGVMRTADAVTTVGGLAIPFAFFSLLYLALGIAVAWLLKREVSASPAFPLDGDYGKGAG